MNCGGNQLTSLEQKGFKRNGNGGFMMIWMIKGLVDFVGE